MGTDAAVLVAQRDLLKVKLERTIIHSPLTGAIARARCRWARSRRIGRPALQACAGRAAQVPDAHPERFAASLHMGQEVRLGIAPIPTSGHRKDHAHQIDRRRGQPLILIERRCGIRGLIKPGFFGSG